jgi:7-carboxy-7-deazaguanine synthase
MPRPLLISETFHSIQGEGTYTGRPSFFIRTSGCNLRCSWCDTPYTSWKPEGQLRSVDSLFMEAAAGKSEHVVITGGEPMLFPEQVGELCDLFSSDDRREWVTTIETNGTIYDPNVEPDLWSVSPKLPTSYPTEAQARELALHAKNNVWANLKHFNRSTAQFKFVATSPADIAEVERAVAAHGLDLKTVWLMPEGRTREEVLDKAGWLAEECKARGWNLSLRAHTLMWGAKRGV